MVASLTAETKMTRLAIRFLMDQKAGLLFTLNNEDDEPSVTRVFYTLDNEGALVAYLPKDSTHLKSIQKGGVSTLTVEAPERYLPRWIELEEDDPATTISHVQADIQPEIIEDPVEITDYLIEWFEDKDKALNVLSQDEVTQIIINQFVAVRMHINSINIYQKVTMYEAVALAG